MNRQNDSSRGLLEAWHALRRFRWRFVLPAFCVSMAVIGAGFLLPRKYQAEAIFERRTDMVLSELLSRSSSRTWEDPRHSLGAQITGGAAIDQVLEQLQAELRAAAAKKQARHLDLDDLRADLSRKLLVRHEVASPTYDRVRLSYIGQDPQVARLAVNGLVEHYISQTRSELEQRLRQSERFFEDQTGAARKRLEQVEEQKLRFELEHAQMMPETPNSLQALTLEAQNQSALAQQKRETAALRLAALRQSLETTPAVMPQQITGRNAQHGRLEQRLAEAEKKLATYATYKMTEKHPDMIALREEIAGLKQQVEQTPAQTIVETREAPNPKHAELELLITTAGAEQDAAERQIRKLEQRLRQLEAQSSQVFTVRSEYRRHVHEVQQCQRQVAFWEDNLQRVRLPLAAESGNRGIQLEFVRPCGPLRRPISPNLAQILVAALGLGLGAGVLSVLIAHRTDESFSDSRQMAQNLDLPLFGSVSRVASRSQRRVRQLVDLVLFPANVAVMTALLAGSALVLHLHLRDPALVERLWESRGQAVLQQFKTDSVADAAPAQPME